MSSYAVPEDLAKYGIAATAIASIPSDVQQAALDSASELADSYFRSRYLLPFTKWGNDVRRVVAVLATYDLLVVRGYNPASGADINLRLRYDDALAWLRQVSRQEAHPDVTPSMAQAAGYDDPHVSTHALRGW